MKERGVEDQWVIDSAAIGNWHEGNPADSRARNTLKNHDIVYTGRARQVAYCFIKLTKQNVFPPFLLHICSVLYVPTYLL